MHTRGITHTHTHTHTHMRDCSHSQKLKQRANILHENQTGKRTTTPTRITSTFMLLEKETLKLYLSENKLKFYAKNRQRQENELSPVSLYGGRGTDSGSSSRALPRAPLFRPPPLLPPLTFCLKSWPNLR